MKIALTALVSLAVGLTVLYMVFLRAPAPAAVCAHIVEVTRTEAGESQLSGPAQEALMSRITEDCIQHKQDKLQLRGRIEYARYARCVVEHDTLQGIEGC